jgi:putative ABC transport system ATP-binding protein
MTTILRASNIRKSFIVSKGVIDVLRGVDLSIAKGEFVAIQGASGSGKSTLLSLLAGLDRSTSGEIELDGLRLDGLSENELARVRREKIGFVFQAFHLVPSLTLLENICLPAAFQKNSFSIEKGRALLENVGLSHRADFFPEQISGGEKQRAAIARALVNDPAVVFADEPTGNLDSVNGAKVLELLESQTKKSGRTLILVTHDLEIANRADRRIHLKDGVVLPE